MSPQDQALLERFREKARNAALKGVDFLNNAGRHCKAMAQVKKIRVTFHDGTVITLPKRLERHFDKQIFHLRPKLDS
jgi:hypothetical protein